MLLNSYLDFLIQVGSRFCMQTKSSKILFIVFIMVVIVLNIVFFSVIFTSKPVKLRQQLNLGNKFFLDENYEDAVMHFKRAIQIDPKAVKPYIALSNTYQKYAETVRAEEPEKALTLYDRAADALDVMIVNAEALPAVTFSQLSLGSFDTETDVPVVERIHIVTKKIRIGQREIAEDNGFDTDVYEEKITQVDAMIRDDEEKREELSEETANSDVNQSSSTGDQSVGGDADRQSSADEEAGDNSSVRQDATEKEIDARALHYHGVVLGPKDIVLKMFDAVKDGDYKAMLSCLDPETELTMSLLGGFADGILDFFSGGTFSLGDLLFGEEGISDVDVIACKVDNVVMKDGYDFIPDFALGIPGAENLFCQEADVTVKYRYKLAGEYKTSIDHYHVTNYGDDGWRINADQATSEGDTSDLTQETTAAA